MKDFHDLRALSQLFPFDGEILAEAIERTFERRKTAIPTIAAPPRAFTEEFFEDESKQRQWDGFNTKNHLYIEAVPLKRVVGDIERFLMPIITGVGLGRIDHLHNSHSRHERPMFREGALCPDSGLRECGRDFNFSSCGRVKETRSC